MPTLPLASLLTTLTVQNGTNATSLTNSSSNALQVICAFPLSGQYGPGSRLLYYALVAACVIARKAEWLRNACLAAALILPAVAAIHGIVLAAVPIEGAVDMDIYGAFQLCSIGILAAPVTVRVSKTYFYDPGRNTIFVWTGLILAGLLSLTVEFFRVKAVPCSVDADGNPAFFTVGNFTYDTQCGLKCDTTAGPFSPLRGGSANNIYVIPEPHKLTFGTATLLAAACCVPAILSMFFMVEKILQINWKARFGSQSQEQQDLPIQGTNGATPRAMKGVNSLIRMFLTAVEVPVLGAAVLGILILGESNFFSHQVKYQTEPIASVGQWAPIAGTVIAALGSLYVLLAAGVEETKEDRSSNGSMHQYQCSVHDLNLSPRSVASDQFVGIPEAMHINSSDTNQEEETTVAIAPTTTKSTAAPSHSGRRSFISDVSSRRKVAGALIALDKMVGSAADEMFKHEADFRRGKANDFPEIPGEEQRVGNLDQIRRSYNPSRDADGNATPLRRVSSRTGSFISVVTGLGIEDSPVSPAAWSPQPTQAPSSPPSANQISRSSTLPIGRPSIDITDSPESSFSLMPPVRRRADTLEVPQVSYHSSRPQPLSLTPNTASEGQISPTIVLSSEPDISSDAQPPPLHESPASSPPTTHPHSP